MNRLVIVGNGFDLAHGLPTGYGHFVDWYWRKVTNTDYQDDLLKFEVSEKIDFDNISCFKDLFNQLESKLRRKLNKNEGRFYYQVNIDIYGGVNMSDRYVLIFKNILFETICSKHSIQNWVDIENEYYQLLKGCLKEHDNSKVKKLNEEFEQVKKLLEEYLYLKIDQGFDFTTCNDATQLLRHFLITPRYLARDIHHSYLKEFPTDDHRELIEFDDEVVHAYKANTLKQYINHDNAEKNLFLNFNYTPTLEYYFRVFRQSSWQNTFANSEQIQIHGQLNNQDNSINFGFGDEMDDHYKLIEEKDDNEYLKNIKSFQYLQNSNYKDLLDFIDSEKFQVYIMGHSCGLSDRILLNTIFEHKNCKSIKVFYHEKDGKDNYTDIVQNISRHFNKKKMMRDKLVNKSLCQPLPQNIRFAEKK